MKNTLHIVLVLLACCLLSCSSSEMKMKRAAYLWRSNYSLSSSDTMRARALHISCFYVRVFEVHWSELRQMPVPEGVADYWSAMDTCMNQVIPCVYIDNEVFVRCSDAQLCDLAQKVDKGIERFMESMQGQIEWKFTSRYCDQLSKMKWSDTAYESVRKHCDSSRKSALRAWIARCNEIQIDCDWTKSTKKAYFLFLKQLQERLDKQRVSCTLRLWQYRDRDVAGIPPVDRCQLMLYSTGSPDEFISENSIAEPSLIESYLNAPKYPIQLDVAVPIYSWATLFRNNRFVSLIRNYDNLPLRDTAFFVKQDDAFFLVKQDILFKNTYLRSGDLLKIEDISPDRLKAISRLAYEKASLNEDSRITLFSWDSTYFNKYDNETLGEALGDNR